MPQSQKMQMKSAGQLGSLISTCLEIVLTADPIGHRILAAEVIIMSRGCQGDLKMMSPLLPAVRLEAPRGQVTLAGMVALNLVILPRVQETVEYQEALVTGDHWQTELGGALLYMTNLQSNFHMVLYLTRPPDRLVN